MRLEQAIFTSIRSERLDGYQLAARSPGINEELAKELTAWGPAHDSLWSSEPGASSINFHGLSDDRFCISRTVLAGAEYSGRRGGRVYTHMIVVPRDGMERFGGDPFVIFRALATGGRMNVYGDVPAAISTIPLIGRAGEFAPEWLGHLLELVGPATLSDLATAATGPLSITLITDLPIERLFQLLLHQLTLSERLAVSFTTGLKPSSRRPFKMAIVPDDPALARQSQRLNNGRVIEVMSPEPPARVGQRQTSFTPR
jgi:hypothetical protein